MTTSPSHPLDDEAARASLAPHEFDRDWIRRHLAEERAKASLLGEIREAIFGAQDGLVSTLAVVSTVAGASSDRFPILVAWLDDEGAVLRTRAMPPGRIAWSAPGARHVLECSPATRLVEGAVLEPLEGRAPWREHPTRSPV